MSASFQMNFGEAFGFVFRDRRWLPKCALFVLFSILGFLFVPYLFVAGYLLTLSERVARLDGEPLPPWADFGALLRKGWRVFLVRVVYYLPVWGLALVIAGLVLGLILSLGGFGALTGRGSGTPTSLAGLWLLVLIFPLIFLLIPLAFVLPCLTPAADAQLVLHEGQLEPAYRAGAVWRFIRRNIGSYALMVAIYVGGTQLISGAASVGAQFGNLIDGGTGRVAIAAIVAITLVASLVSALARLYLGCAQAHMLGQLCWYEREVRAHER